MRFRIQQNHRIDFLFPFILFFVFALTALSVLLMATGIYQSITDHSSRSHTTRTSLAYISEKLHQNDVNGQVSLGTLDGCDALVIRQQVEENFYCTYIYAFEGELRELFIKEGAAASASSGTPITKINGFTLEEAAENLFRICCLDEDGREQTLLVNIHSKEAERSAP